MMRPFHPLADFFPLIEGDELDQFVASIRKSVGPREPIVVCEDKILDGRNPSSERSPWKIRLS
jgi:hypothetical protein